MSEQVGKTVKMTIDGREGEFPSGMTILEAARQMGIRIPTLCYSEAVSQYGSCRLCVVEVSKRGRKRMVIACMHPVGDLEVRTSTPEIRDSRRTIVEFLLARSPESPELKALYEEYGGGKPPFSIRGGTGGHKDNCILCGLCVRVCAEVIGADAIGFANRGMKKVATPGLMRDSDRCIGCATCVLICPTQAIRVEDINSIAIGHRWGHEADHRHCRLCGSIVSTPEFFTDLGALRKQAGA